MGVKIDSRKVRAGEKWIFRKTTNMTAGARPLRWVGSYTPPPSLTLLLVGVLVPKVNMLNQTVLPKPQF